MSTYSEVSEDYKMFDTKAEVDFYNSIENYVSVEEMMNHMFSVLTEYDRCLDNKQDAKVNPMSGRVMMRVKNGITFEIPENIQKMAIAKYMGMKSKGVVSKKKALNEVEMPVEMESVLQPQMGAELHEMHIMKTEVEQEEYIEGESEMEEVVAEKSIGYLNKLKNIVPDLSKASRKDKIKYTIMTILAFVALYALYRYIDQMIREGKIKSLL